MSPITSEDLAKLTRLLEEAGEGMPHPQAGMAAQTNAVLSALILFIASEAIACMSASNGMPWSDSYALTARVMAETASLLTEKGVHPAQLKDMICQPGSLAIEALHALEQVRLRAAMINACNGACNQIMQNRADPADV